VNRFPGLHKPCYREWDGRQGCGARPLQQFIEPCLKYRLRVGCTPFAIYHRVHRSIAGVQYEARRDAEGLVHVYADVLVGPVEIHPGDQVIHRLIPIGIVQGLVGEPARNGGQNGLCQMNGLLPGGLILATGREDGYARYQYDADNDNGGKGIQNVTQGRLPALGNPNY